MKNNILLIGSGSREHAIAWKLLQSEHVDKVIVVPGNASNVLENRIINVACSSINVDTISEIANQYNVEFVFIGPEQPLVDGIVNGLKKKGISCFGPSLKASEIEGSKVFCKDFMIRHNIPTAKHQSFTDYNEACKYIESVNYNIVLKASGCAAGKGVLIPSDKKEALEGIKRIMVDKEFGSAGDQVVIEQFLNGQECSLMCFSDGYSISVCPPAQDHKRVFDNDQGPNTGGMGAYAPTPFVTQFGGVVNKGRHGFGHLIDRAVDTVLQPTIDGMRKDGRPFVGVLFAGLMIDETSGEINVLEFNCRMGDPETQVVLPLLETDLYEVVLACIEGRLDSIKLCWKDQYAVTVVAASKGYPDSYPKGLVISGLNNSSSSDEIIFQAGTKANGNEIVTNGGRVLSITSLNSNLQQAINQCYTRIATVNFDGMQYRKDIGKKALVFLASANTKHSVSYSESGVDIERGDAVVDNIASFAKNTVRSGCVSDLGGFGALFDTKAAGFKDPILVSGTDGVGTKLKIAQELGKHDSIGIDLVAMCVNDVVVQGAEPLFFLDYFATGKIHVDVATKVISGIAKGCKLSGCALIGGETAEMPGMYKEGEYDLAGFSVGAVERTDILPNKNIAPGNVLLALASSGIHSNGYSLVRYLIETKSGLKYTDKAPFDPTAASLGDALLTPTKLYVLSCLAAIKAGGVNGLAHITGGGITENLPRVLPKGMDAQVTLSSWTIPPIFQYLNQLGNMETLELLKTFNCGIGMILIVEKDRVESIKSVLESHNETVYQIGEIIANNDTNSKVVYN
ncbi:hypothetical protein CYY_002409 [Polysphondylium violaceum]|uniref:ATP-grasp domain-containing protein n=1 Tax=Polysphondylium violaceum TaxID=133409 RepID=A0A8J4Q067_9MYCE|nr:hypothetical protein CYY_002409 [Polysphondylium violaceum]